MAFNPLQNYHTVVDLDGNIFAFQSGVYYDKYNNAYTSLPPSKGGYAAPVDQTIIASMTGGSITGTTIDSSPLGGTTPAAAHFTTVGATGQITSTLATGTAPLVIASTTNVANLNASSLAGATFAAPGAIGGGTAAAANFTSIGASGQVTSTVTTGTAPLVVASTTNVANLNASSLGGATFAAPGAIGGGTAAAANFTTIGATGQITSTLAIGTAPLVITSTTNVPNLNASSLGGATFAAPGAIGGTTPAAMTMTSQNGGQLAGFRNKVRNGNMNVAQRGATYALTNALAYGSMDGWVAYQAGTAAGIFNQVAGPATGGINNYAKLGRTAASAQLGAYLAQQALMSTDSIPLAGQTVTLSFVAYAGANYSAATSLFNANVYTGTGTDQSSATMQAWTGVANPATVAQAITTTPTRYFVTGTIAAAATQIGVSFGYTPVGTAGADDNVYFSNVQIEIGPVATPYEIRSDAMEDNICRYQLRIFPAWVTATGSPTTILATMRTTPTVSASGTPAGFASTSTNAEAILISQTTPALQTITATAEL